MEDIEAAAEAGAVADSAAEALVALAGDQPAAVAREGDGESCGTGGSPVHNAPRAALSLALPSRL